MKKVSVIMSTYNTNDKYLFESINSILEQKYQNIELIIVCDGIKDEYEKIKKEILDKRVILLYNNENIGLAASLNKALHISSGEYIARMDSDDICKKNRISKQVKYLEKNPQISICSTNARLFGTVIGTKSNYFKNSEEIKCQVLFKATHIHPTIMARREVFEKYKYNEEYMCSQDFELWSKISKIYKMKILNFIGIKYRVHKDQISETKQKIQKKNSRKIIERNSMNISGNKKDDIVIETLWLLSGRQQINKKNISDLENGIEYILKKNKETNVYNSKILKKVLYNRFFELSIKNKTFCFKMNYLKKYFKLYNLNDILKKILHKF